MSIRQFEAQNYDIEKPGPSLYVFGGIIREFSRTPMYAKSMLAATFVVLCIVSGTGWQGYSAQGGFFYCCALLSNLFAL